MNPHRSTQPIPRPDLLDPDLEVEFLISTLSALESIAHQGGGDHVQFTGSELHGMFRTLKLQVERIGLAMEKH